MNEFQKRVINEKEELDLKIESLGDFITLWSSNDFEDLNADEQKRLKEQFEVMWKYSKLLEERISCF